MKKQLFRTGINKIKTGYYMVKCINYIDKNTYWLKEGKLARCTCANSAYDFVCFAQTWKNLKKNGVYTVSPISN